MPDAARSWSRPILVLVFYLALASAGIVVSTQRGDASLWRLAGREDPQILAGIAVGAVLGLGIVFAWRFAAHRFRWGREFYRELRDLLGPLPRHEIVVLAVASALGEEVFFRGALLPWLGLWVSSGCFALLHMGPKSKWRTMSLPWVLSSFATGLLFGQLFLWSGDLGGPVVAHFTVNALNLRYLANTDLR